MYAAICVHNHCMNLWCSLLYLQVILLVLRGKNKIILLIDFQMPLSSLLLEESVYGTLHRLVPKSIEERHWVGQHGHFPLQR